MKNAKSFLFALALSLLSLPAIAQINVGGGLSFGTQVETLGIFGRGEYQVNETWRGAATFNYFFWDENIPGIDISWFTLNFDAHYVLSENDPFQLYALGGLNLAFVQAGVDLGPFGSVSETTTDFGLNVGAGARYGLTESISAIGEVKYVIGSADQLVFLIGVVFGINN